MNYVSFLVFLLLAVSFTIHFLRRIRHAIASKSSSSRKLPPGPFRLPIFGNLFNLGLHKPYESLAELAKTYGPVMTLQLGSLTTVVISSASIAKEVLQTKDISFCNRPVVDAARALDHYLYSMAWLPVDTLWRNLRKISNNLVLSSSKLDANQGLQQKKVADLLRYVEKCCHAGTSVDIGEAAFNTMFNLLANIFFSVDLAEFGSEVSQDFHKLAQQITVELGKPSLSDFYPVLERIDLEGRRHRLSIYLAKMADLFNTIIDNRLADKINSAQRTDVLEVLLRNSQENNKELDQFAILHLLLDFFTTGAETTSSTLEWAMTELLQNPDKMMKAQAEIREVIGERNCQPIGEANIHRLPYLQAVVKETLRLHPPATLLLPRKVDTDVNLGQFVVPKNSMVVVNAWAIGRDTTFWENPQEFEPERFLGLEIDVKGRDFELIPFGAGRRICPGLSLAVRMLDMMLGSLIHSFEWKLENGIEPEIMNMVDKLGTAPRKSHPLRLIPIRS